MAATRRLCCAVGLVAIFALALPSAAQAQVCSTFVASIPDGRISGPWPISSGGNGLSWDFGVTSGRSYSVEVLEHSGSVGATMIVGNGFCPASNIAGLRDTTTIDPSSGTTGTCCFLRRSFTATASGFLEVTVTTPGSTSVNLSATETTMFSPVWSTNGTFDTFYSFQNTTNASCAIALSLFNTAGTLIDTFSTTVVAAATASTNTQALATTRNLTGTAKLTHDCPPGGIQAEAAVANFTISPTPYFQPVKFGPVRSSR
jgi:hypothetical protein